MFGALRQGSIIYILEKGEKLALKTGQVISITQPNYSNLVSINVKIGEDSANFCNVPSSQAVTTYNNVTITETKELMLSEVENLLQNSRNIINSINYHNNIISSGEEILKELNPRFAKEKERDEDISNLKNQIGDIENKMDKILTLLSK